MIADAYKYVNDNDKQKYDVIIMDINYEEEDIHLSPPKKFLEPDFVQKLMVR